MYGWTGKILHIDLTDRAHGVEQPAEALYHTRIGGKGLAGAYLRPHATRDWRDPEMPLLFMTGPLVGTVSPTSGRMCIMSRSPLTGTIGDASVGGQLGTQIKRASFDGIVITGRSKRSVGIEIANGIVTFRDATDCIGTTATALYGQLKDRGAVALTGPAAENGVLFSSVMVDGAYTAGRNGLGLIFAAKNLKYVTVSGT
ncbi:MAG: aldehyde:ferredoxin oxidoreductase, partial [Candidatus Hydrogenedentes bacterium]|nr:aldehyde:ferredoxin oxidoreductase [Candidatus Hydrogenedentota bacterium]